jgi:hypothetical protein
LTVIRGVVIVVHIAPIERLLAACGNGPSGRLSSQLSISRFDGGQSRSPDGSGRQLQAVSEFPGENCADVVGRGK